MNEDRTVYINGIDNSNEDEFNRTVYLGAESISESSQTENSGEITNTDIDMSHCLPTNTMLRGRYRIGKVLGEGGFGITYSGWDITLNIPVAIKEYFPFGVVARNSTLGKTTEVITMSSSKNEIIFREGIDKVLDEARRMAKFRNTPGIVGVYDFFEANNTAYIVMEYVNGCTLDEYRKNNRVDCTTLFNFLVPVMDAVQALHEEGIIHRDISPDNIMVDEDGNFKLLDFGASRGFAEDNSATMSIILKKSYAPEEQFRTKGNQGPWTDVYALGATVYELITGTVPPTSIDRLVEDEIIDVKELAPSLTKTQAQAIMKSLEVKQTNRWQSMDEFKNALINSLNKEEKESKNKQDISKSSENLDKVKWGKNKTLIIAAISILVIAILIIVFASRNNKNSSVAPDVEKDITIEEKSNSIPETSEKISTSEETNENEENDIVIVDEFESVPFLGVYTEYLDTTHIEEVGDITGMKITEVLENSPAEEAGLKVDDIILKISGEKIDNDSKFSEMLGSYSIGDSLEIEYLSLTDSRWESHITNVSLGKKSDFESAVYSINPNGNIFVLDDQIKAFSEKEYLKLYGVMKDVSNDYSCVVATYDDSDIEIEFFNPAKVLYEKYIEFGGGFAYVKTSKGKVYAYSDSGRLKEGIEECCADSTLSECERTIQDLYALVSLLDDEKKTTSELIETENPLSVKYKSFEVSSILSTGNIYLELTNNTDNELSVYCSKISINGRKLVDVLKNDIDGCIATLKPRETQEISLYSDITYFMNEKPDSVNSFSLEYYLNNQEDTFDVVNIENMNEPFVFQGDTWEEQEQKEKEKEKEKAKNAENYSVERQARMFSNYDHSNFKVSYTGGETTTSQVKMYFCIENIGDMDIDFSYYYKSKINNSIVNMTKASSVTSYEILPGGKTLLTACYTKKDLEKMGITTIDNLEIRFCDENDTRDNDITAIFDNVSLKL